MLEVVVAIIVTIPPSVMAYLSWRSSHATRSAVETGNGSTLAEYAMRIDNKLDLVEKRQIAHDQRDRMAFQAAGLPYPDADE